MWFFIGLNCKEAGCLSGLAFIHYLIKRVIDTLTHIVLGATVGDVQLGKKLGKRALFLGALAQSIPDIDFVASIWNDTASGLLAHRGFTHSILFLVITSIGLALLAEHYYKPHKVGYNKWILFFGLQMSIHLFIDLFNSYGTGLLEPFSHQRFSLNALFVADPFFSVWPAISMAALLFLGKHARSRAFWQKFGLVLPSLYLVYCLFNKVRIDNDLSKALVADKLPYKNYFTTPTPLNNWLWYLAVDVDTGFYVGYRSVFDRRKQLDLHYFSRNDSFLRPVSNTEEVQRLLRFSQGYYTVEHWHDTLVFNDLRFGQMIGWYDPRERFVFHYYLQREEKDNKLVVQRGRFAKWNWETTESLIRRIAVN